MPGRPEALAGRWRRGPAGAAALHLWVERVPAQPRHEARALRLLDAAERARADRFVRPQDRRLYIASHARLRELLGAACGCEPRQVRYASGPHGKPVLRWPRGCSFNLSHSGSIFAILLGPDRRRIGVDVEPVHRFADPAMPDHPALSPEESAVLARLPAADRPLALARRWTAKEACAKADGRGLGLGFDRITVRFGPAGRYGIVDESGRGMPGRGVQRLLDGRHGLVPGGCCVSLWQC